MKTSTILTICITVVLMISGDLLFAGSSNPANPVSKAHNGLSLISLAPATPLEATFEDMPSELIFSVNLAPTTPAVADFEDAGTDLQIDLESLAPATPTEADFE
jgi:hypothetical protein